MNESSNVSALDSTPGLTTLEEAFYLGTGITGFAFNALVLFIAYMFVDTYDKPRQLIVINMTAADLVMCLIYMATRPYLQYFPSYLCYPYYVIVCSSQLCSCFNLLWLNLDKLVFVQFPLHYYSVVTRIRLMVLTTMTWLILGLFAAIGYSSLRYVDDANLYCSDNDPSIVVNQFQRRCDMVFVGKAFFVSIMISYVLILLSSFTISVIIFTIARRTSRMEKKSHSKKFRQLFFLFSSTLWTFFTCLPYRALYLYAYIENVVSFAPRPPDFFHTLVDIFFRILVLGMVIFITGNNITQIDTYLKAAIIIKES
uniref:G_PROTEIN_RECEP_F1_2 domain-containing protein n=1 Tax=Syphacia muris TaxID=451379 RepID=A0A0N5ARV5_9BILA